MATHKALVLEEFGTNLVLKDVATPSVTSGSALVAPLFASIPPTLSMALSGALKDFLPTFPPYIPGSYCVARILSLPDDATTLRVGDLVWVDPMIRGRDNPHLEIVRSLDGGRDPSSQNLMKRVWEHGTYEEKLLVPLEGLFTIPENWVRDKEKGGKGFQIKDFALSGYYLLAVGGLATAGVRAGDTVIIAPATGEFSSAAVRVALAMGCKVVAIGRSIEKLKALEQYDALKDATSGKGADVFVDYTPSTLHGEIPYLMAGINSLRRGGEYLLLGGAFTDLKIPYVEIIRQELRIRGKFMWAREHVELFMRLIDTGSLNIGAEGGVLDKLETFRLDEVEIALKQEPGSEHGEERLLTPNVASM